MAFVGSVQDFRCRYHVGKDRGDPTDPNGQLRVNFLTLMLPRNDITSSNMQPQCTVMHWA